MKKMIAMLTLLVVTLIPAMHYNGTVNSPSKGEIVPFVEPPWE